MTDLAGETGYRLVADDLRQKIEDGTYPVGSQLPSYRKIETLYDVSSDIARRAVKLLRDEGVVATTQGLGTKIVARPSDTPPAPTLGEAVRLIAEIRDEVYRHRDEIAELRAEVARLQPPRAGSPARPGSKRPRRPTPPVAP